MALDAETAAGGLIRKVQKALGKGSPAALLAPLLYARDGLSGLESLPADWLAGNAREAMEFIADKPKGRHKIRVRRMPAGRKGAPPEGSVVEILNDDMPFLVDSVLGELQARGLAVRFLFHPIFKTERDKAGRLQTIAGAGDEQLGRRAPGKLHRHPPARPAGDRGARSGGDALRHPGGGARRGRRLAGDAAAPRGGAQAAGAGAGEPPERRCWARRRAFLHWLEQANFTFLGARSFELTGDADTGDLAPGGGQRPRRAARRRRAGAAPRQRAGGDDARGAALLLRAVAAHHHQGQRREPRAPARAHGLHRHQDLPRRRQAEGRDPLRRPVHLAGLRELAQPDPSAAPQGRDGARGLRLPGGQPRRQGAAQRPRHVSRATSCSRSAPRSCRRGAKASSTSRRGRACACSRASTGSTASCRRCSTCRATATTRACASASARCCARPTTAASPPSIPTSPKARWCACSSSSPASPGRRRRPTSPSWSAGSSRSCAPGRTGWPTPSATQGERAEALQAKYGTAFSAGYAETFPAERALEDIKRIERLGPEHPVVIDFYRVPGMPASRIHAAVYSLGAPIPPVRARAGAGEPGLLGHRRALLSHPAALCRTASAT